MASKNQDWGGVTQITPSSGETVIKFMDWILGIKPIKKSKDKHYIIRKK